MDNYKNQIKDLDDRIASLQSLFSGVPQNTSDISNLLSLIYQQISTLRNEHDKDFSLLNKDLDNFKEHQNQSDNLLQKYKEELEDSIEDLNEKYQETRGEINQLKLIIDSIKSEITEKKDSKNNILTNVVYPVIVAIFVSGVIWMIASLTKLSNLNNMQIEQQKVNYNNQIDK